MSSAFILKLLRTLVTIFFYLNLLFIILFLVGALSALFQNDNEKALFSSKVFSYDAKQFGLGDIKDQQVFSYSKDSIVRYKQVSDHFKLEVVPRSTIGYYTIFGQLILMSVSLAILWGFMQLFKQVKLLNPFSTTSVTWLKRLALLFVISDILNLINYFIVSAMLSTHFSYVRVHFELITNVGSGIITGLIIWIIAVIFQRGIELQEENALTV
jgi:hypothetical protein